VGHEVVAVAVVWGCFAMSFEMLLLSFGVDLGEKKKFVGGVALMLVLVVTTGGLHTTSQLSSSELTRSITHFSIRCCCVFCDHE
jgi:hypothetical protein